MPREVFIELMIPKRERPKWKQWLEAHDELEFPHREDRIVVLNRTKKEAYASRSVQAAQA